MKKFILLLIFLFHTSLYGQIQIIAPGGGTASSCEGCDLGQLPATAPPSSGWTWVNQGTATIDSTVPGTIYLTHTGTSGTHDSVLYVRSAGANTIWTAAIRADALFTTGSTSNSLTGIALRNSSSGQIIIFGLQQFGAINSQSRFIGYRFTNPTTYHSDLGTPGTTFRFANIADGATIWFRAALSGGVVTFSVSLDGAHWRSIYTETVATFLTTFDQVGLVSYGSNQPATESASIMLISWVGV